MVGAAESELRKVRGNDISFIFQEPMTSLNPLHTIEKQLAESLTLHQGLTRRRGRAADHRAAGKGRHRRPREPAECLSAPAVAAASASG